jgi:hypothetical protein
MINDQYTPALVVTKQGAQKKTEPFFVVSYHCLLQLVSHLLKQIATF